MIIAIALAATVVYSAGFGVAVALLEDHPANDDLKSFAVLAWPVTAPGLVMYTMVRRALDRHDEQEIPQATARQAEDLIGPS